MRHEKKCLLCIELLVVMCFDAYVPLTEMCRRTLQSTSKGFRNARNIRMHLLRSHACTYLRKPQSVSAERTMQIVHGLHDMSILV